MSWTLCVDTCSSHAYLALCSSSNQSFTSAIKSDNSHDEELANRVETLFLEAKLDQSEVSEIVVGNGPGSFTGLKIGFSFAKGFALSREIPLVSYSSFAAAASCLFSTAKLIVVISDARAGEVFLSVFHGDPARIDDPALSVQTVPLTNYWGVIKKLAQKNDIENSQVAIINFGLKHEKLETATDVPDLALGLWQIHCWRKNQGFYPKYDLGYLADLQPNYIRQVAAKTIEERKRVKIDKEH